MISQFFWLLFWGGVIFVTVDGEGLTLIGQTRTGSLSKYSSYVDATMMHFDVPAETSFVSFKFHTEDTSYSLFGCGVQEVVLFLTRGSPPVINPDGAKFPRNFYLDSKPDIYTLSLNSDHLYEYINLTNPTPGSYFVAAFHPYKNPQDEGITQEGLTPQCQSYLDAYVYARLIQPRIRRIVPNVDLKIETYNNESLVYKFSVPSQVDHIILTFKNVKLCENCPILLADIYTHDLPSNNFKTIFINVTQDTKDISITLWVSPSADYYVSFKVKDFLGKTTGKLGDFNFLIKPIKGKFQTNETFVRSYIHETGYLRSLPTKQYELYKSLSSDNFLYTYEMQPLKDGSIPAAINVTNEEVISLKFHVKDILDVGGSLQAILAFKPIIVKKGRFLVRESLPVEYTILGCIRNGAPAIPTYPHHCKQDEILTVAPIILNGTKDNNTFLIPYPEPGDWYLTLKLFCNACAPCECPTSCQEKFGGCTADCEAKCEGATCDQCIFDCETKTVGECGECNCDANCKRNDTHCNTTVLFDISSYPCVSQGCGSNGKCAFMLSEGFAYSSCVCSNKYKGWDCSDGSDANSMAMVVLELALLVISNIMFLPAAVVAFKRKYYPESVVYFSTCVSSTFYHACDAGEKIISFCIMPLGVLQFCDFYCALLSIWVTLVAIAYVPQPWPPILHIAGAIVLGTGTTLDKTSIWVFVLPVTVGVITVAISWGYKYYKTRVLFPNKRYLKVTLPIGLIIVIIALLFYGLLQTQRNYKYVHSLWHMMMATALIILLPNLKTFLPDNVAYL